MNVERWIKARNASWLRLEELLARVAKGGLSSLRRTELQELGLLYRTISSDLSRARAMRLGQDMQIYLNNLVVKAHNQVYQRKIDRGGDVLDCLPIRLSNTRSQIFCLRGCGFFDLCRSVHGELQLCKERCAFWSNGVDQRTPSGPRRLVAAD